MFVSFGYAFHEPLSTLDHLERLRLDGFYVHFVNRRELAGGYFEGDALSVLFLDSLVGEGGVVLLSPGELDLG